MLKKNILVLLLTLIMGIGLVRSQCIVEHNLFPMELNSGVESPLFGPDGQTFTACQSGEIISISIKMSEGGVAAGLAAANTYTGNMNLWIINGATRVFAGAGAADPPYQIWDIDDANPTGVQVINLTTPFPVVAGSVYTFGFGMASGDDAPDMTVANPVIDTGVNQSPPTANDHTYSAGLIYFNNGSLSPAFDTTGDINFSVSIAPLAPSSVPTLSEWGIFILLLSIVALGYVFIFNSVKKKEVLTN